MKLTIDFSEYRPWSGAIGAWEKIEAAGKLDNLEAVLEEGWPEGLTTTELNDILWFEPEFLFDRLGVKTNEEEEEERQDEFDRFL